MAQSNMQASLIIYLKNEQREKEEENNKSFECDEQYLNNQAISI